MNEKYTLPPPEDVILNNQYAFTVNMPVSKGDTEHSILARYVLFFKSLSEYVDFKFFKEYSKTAKVHYHGYVIFRKYSDIIPFYQFIVGYNVCIEMDTISPKYWDVTTRS